MFSPFCFCLLKDLDLDAPGFCCTVGYCCLNTLHWLQLFNILHANGTCVSWVPNLVACHYFPHKITIFGLAFFWHTHHNKVEQKQGTGFTSLWKGQLPAFKWVLVWFNIERVGHRFWLRSGLNSLYSPFGSNWAVPNSDPHSRLGEISQLKALFRPFTATQNKNRSVWYVQWIEWPAQLCEIY